MPSQRPNRGISLIVSVVFHHTPTTTHTLALACNPAWTSRHKQMHAHKYTRMHVYTHTMTDCSSLIWCFSQWFISILWPGNCLQNACSEKTHSDDLGQIEALPSATDNSGLEWRQNFKERGRGGGRDCLKTRCTTDDKTRGVDIYSVVCQTDKYFALCVWVCVCVLNEYAQSKLFTFTSIKLVKAVCLYIHISPFVMWCYKLLWASHVSMQQHLKGKCFLFSLISLWLLRKLGCKGRPINKDLPIYSMSEEWFFSHPFCM